MRQAIKITGSIELKKVIIILIGIIAVSYIVGVFFTQHLYTEINIKASPKVVWNHLTDFKEYPEWNPFIKKISGELSVGSQLAVTIQPPGKDSMDFKPTLLIVKNNEELRWLGRVLIPKLFDGEHYFTIIVNNDGTTKFIQGENFSGILALLLWSSMEQDTKNGFEEMNKAIKIRSEATK